MNNPKELQTKIEQLRKEISDANTNRYDSVADISKKQSEIFVLASQLAEISTRRIIYLTWALAFLTFILLVFTVLPIFFPKNFDFKVKCVQTTQDHQIAR